MTNSSTFINEIIKMIPVITGALITGVIAVMSTIVSHHYTTKKERKAMMLTKIEELSRELNEYHTLIISQSINLASTGQMMNIKDKTFHLVILVNIYVPQLFTQYDKYIKEAHSNIYDLMRDKEKKFDIDKIQKLYTDLMTSIGNEARKFIS